MLVWFASIAALGVPAIAHHPRGAARGEPDLRRSRSSHEHGERGFLVLGAVVLVHHRRRGAVRGHGALRRASRSASPGTRWCCRRCCSTTSGRARCLLAEGARAVGNPFYALVPAGPLYPMVVVATVATVIASQALISGAFSLTQQAVQLGYWPRVTHRAHLGARGRADLHPRDQLGADGGVRGAGARVPQVGQPGGGVRHRGHRHHDDHVAAVLRGRAAEAGAGRARVPAWCWRCSCRSTCRSSSRT